MDQQDIEDVQIYRQKVRELHATLVTAREAEGRARSEHAKARSARKDAEQKLQAFLERDSVPLPLFDRPKVRSGKAEPEPQEVEPEKPAGELPIEDAASRGLSRENLTAAYIADRFGGKEKLPPLVRPVAIDGSYWVCPGMNGTVEQMDYTLLPLEMPVKWADEIRARPGDVPGWGAYEGVRVKVQAGKKAVEYVIGKTTAARVIRWTKPVPLKRFDLPFDTEDLLAWPAPPALQVRLGEIFAAEGFPPMPSPVAVALATAEPELRTLADLLRAAYLLEDVAADLRLRIMSVCEMAGLIEGHRMAAADRVMAVVKDLDWPAITSSYPAWGELVAMLSPSGLGEPALTYGAGQVDAAIQSLTGTTVVPRIDGRSWQPGDELPGLGLVVAVRGQHGHLLGQCRVMRTAKLGNGRIEVKARCPTAAMGNWEQYLAGEGEEDDRYPTCEEIEVAVTRGSGEGKAMVMMGYEDCEETGMLEFRFLSTDEMPGQEPVLTKKGRAKR